MIELKPLTELTEADERNLYYVVNDSGGNARRLSLEDIYAEVEDIVLHDGVPQHIQDHFSQARHLAIYSWFHYPFNVTSMMLGFVCVEYALKEKTGKPRAGLKRLIQIAIDNKWIKDKERRKGSGLQSCKVMITCRYGSQTPHSLSRCLLSRHAAWQ